MTIIMINSMQVAIIKRDIKSVSENKNLFLALLIVPLMMTVVLPSIFVLIVGLTPIDSSEFQDLLSILPTSLFGDDLRSSLMRLIINNIIPCFYLLIPVMASSVTAASAFIGEKEKKTLETLLYCPLSLRQIFSAKVLSSFTLSQFVSVVSFVVMTIIVQVELKLLTGEFFMLGINWLVMMILVSPAFSLIAITLIVRVSAKAKTVEESQQRSVFLILPIILLAVGQFSGLLFLNALVLLCVGVICAVIGIMLLRRSSGNFNYETLLQ